jgi:CRISPR/Cas system-associated exonuclease Cas4 (RecB family)
MTLKKDAPYIWVTWITKLIVGKDSCAWSAWFKSHHKDYERAPSDFDTLSWNIKHTNLLDQVDQQYRQRFPSVHREHQNAFKYHGSSGAILAGKPDLVGFSGTELRVCDVKTGQLQDEHWAQMLLYMYFLPKCYPQVFKGKEIVGELVYPDSKQEVYMEEFDEHLKVRVMSVLQAISSNEPPVAVPSSQECRYCVLTSASCKERIESGLENRQVELGEF